MFRVLRRGGAIRHLLPKGLRRSLVRASRWPRVGAVGLGDLRRLSPISRSWGGDRGTPVDRYYIEAFLAAHASDIRGRVLEVGDDAYTSRFGADRVIRSDVIDIEKTSAKVNVVADLADAPQVPSDRYDCFICTQTLQLIPDVAAAVGTLARILKPAGVALVTCPVISKLAVDEEGRWHDCWRFSSAGARLLFERHFDAAGISVEAPGNVLAAVAFLEGLAAQELAPEELEHRDPEYELLVTVRAVKGEGRDAQDGG